MSAHSDSPHHDTEHGGMGDHAAHGTMKGYLTGFGLSVVLTAIPFWLVMSGILGNAIATGILVIAFAIVQIVVHMIYFLHLNTESEGGWNMLSLIFTLILVVIAIVGSLWVMYHLDVNMMPGMMSETPG